MSGDDAAPGNGKKRWQSYKEKKEAIAKYQEKKSRIVLWISPEEKEAIAEEARNAGQSMTQYILSALNIQRGEKNDED